jgi:hypothetical protein
MSSWNDVSTVSDPARSLRVERGERVLLAPTSERFKDRYRQLHPRTAADIRAVIGISADTAKALRDQGACCEPSDESTTVSADDFDSSDGAVRERVWRVAHAALTRYTYSAYPESLRHAEPLIARYLAVTEAVLNIITLPDIEIDEGGTLMVPADTHLVTANKVFIHKTGRIVCSGFTKFQSTSLEGGL